jgi:AGZA family xanthine/uracil permease-like MFS transporter
VAAWGALMAKTGLRAAGLGTVEAPFTEELVAKFEQLDTHISGAFALEQGFIFTAMLLAGMTVEIIERRFQRAALWALTLAGLSATGLIHSFAWTPGDTVLDLRPAWPWALSYVGVALVLFLARWVSVPADDEPGRSPEPKTPA